MANTYVIYPDQTGGTTDYSIPFDYLSREYVKATVDGASVPLTFLSTHLVRITPGPTGTVKIYRETSAAEPINVYTDGSILIANSLNASFYQNLHISEEVVESSLRQVADGAQWDASHLPIRNIPTPENADEAVSKGYVDVLFTTDKAIVNADRQAAETARNQAVSAATSAASSRDTSTGAATMAEKWAAEDEDVEVVPGEYSAKHWAIKTLTTAGDPAVGIVADNIQAIRDVSGDKDAILAARDDAESARDATLDYAMVAQDVASELTGLREGIAGGIGGQVLVKASNVNYDYTWITTSGLGDMLSGVYDPQGKGSDVFNRANHTGNQPASSITGLGTAASQNVGAFATAAQGEKADSALQTLTAGDNITISGTGTGRTIAATVPPAPVTSVAGKNGDVTLGKADVGLGSVDNTADSVKPVSTAQATAINAKVTKAGDDGLGGFSSAEYDHGNLPSSFTPTLANGNFQRGNKNAAKTINAPATGAYSMQIAVTNTSDTGGLTAVGFDKVNGDFRPDNGAKHMLLINMSAAAKVLTIVEAS